MSKILSAFLICLSCLAAAVALPPDQWHNNTPSATKLTVDGNTVNVTLNGDTVWDTDHYQVLSDLKPGVSYTFAATVTTRYSSWVYLAIKTHKDGKETNRLSSALNRRGKSYLRLPFKFHEGETCSFHLRTLCRSVDQGHEVSFTDICVEEGDVPVPEKAAPPHFEVSPGYTVCGLFLNQLKAADAAHFTAKVDYREAGQQAWLPALPMDYLYGEHRAGSSLVKLREDTEYDVRVTVDDNGTPETLTARFRTKGAPLNIVKTIVIGPDNWQGQLFIDDNATEGYIRYTAKPGFVLRAAPKAPYAISVNSTSRIILDGLTIRGGTRHAVNVEGVDNFVMRNCDIAEWGTAGKQDFVNFGMYYNDKGKRLNNDAGLCLTGVEDVLVENNYFHDPVGCSNSWVHSHPAGPNAIFAGEAVRTTVRFNDCIGGDRHRWNDAIEGQNNGSVLGSFYRDAEIYGNYLAFGDDDGIELDGGQSNCRFFLNKSEGLLCGISTAPCLTGPSYIFENLICDLSDQYGLRNCAIKNNFGDSGKGIVHFYNNTIDIKGLGISDFGGSGDRTNKRYPGLLHSVGLNNLIRSRNTPFSWGLFGRFGSRFDYSLLAVETDSYRKLLEAVQQLNQQQDEHAVRGVPVFQNETAHKYALAENSPGYRQGVSIPNFLPQAKPSIGAIQPGGNTELPYRPLAYVTSHTKLTFDCLQGKRPAPQQITVSLFPKAKADTFTVCLSADADWVTVSPMTATVTPDAPVTLTVTVHPDKLVHARRHHTAFILRNSRGLSRPVSVYADNSDDSIRLAADRRHVLYGTVEQNDQEATLRFQVKNAGNYFLFVRYDSSSRSYNIEWQAPGCEFIRANHYADGTTNGPKWYFLGNNSYSSRPNRAVHLEPGTHEFKIRALPKNRLIPIVKTAIDTEPNLILAPEQP